MWMSSRTFKDGASEYYKPRWMAQNIMQWLWERNNITGKKKSSTLLEHEKEFSQDGEEMKSPSFPSTSDQNHENNENDVDITDAVFDAATGNEADSNF